MKNIFTFLILLANVTSATSQNFEWALNGKGTIESSRIASDKAGNTFLCGSFSHKCIFTDTILGQGDGFLARFDPDGNELWLQDLKGTNGGAAASDVAIDDAGNIYIIGNSDNGITIGNFVLAEDGAFLAKFSTAGNVIWVHHLASSCYVNFIDCGSPGNIFISGAAEDTIDLGCATILPSSFFARYDTAGNCQWVQNASVNGYVFGVAADINNDLYITGSFLYPFTTFGSITINSTGGQDAYLAKINSQGNWAWAKGFDSFNGSQGLAIDGDLEGHVFFSGYFTGSIDFGCTVLTSTGTADIFLSKLDTAGNCIWVQQAGGGLGNQYAFALAVDAGGNSFISGSIIDTTDFGSVTLIPGGENFYVAAYGKNGTNLWAVQAEGYGGSRGIDLACDSTGNVFADGEFYSSEVFNFGNISLQGKYYWIFETKLSSVATVIPIMPNENSLLIYPVPLTSFCTIKLPEIFENDNLYFKVYDALGIMLRTEKLSGTTIFEKGDLKPGIYFYQVMKENARIYYGKLVVN